MFLKVNTHTWVQFHPTTAALCTVLGYLVPNPHRVPLPATSLAQFHYKLLTTGSCNVVGGGQNEAIPLIYLSLSHVSADRMFCFFFQESALFVFVVTRTLQIRAAGPNVESKVWIFIHRLSLLVLKTEACRRGQVVEVTACCHCLSPWRSPTLRLNPQMCYCWTLMLFFMYIRQIYSFFCPQCIQHSLKLLNTSSLLPYFSLDKWVFSASVTLKLTSMMGIR